MMDTYLNSRGPGERQGARGVVTGKPVEIGGSLGRAEATGRGAAYALRHLYGEYDRTLGDQTVAIQGFGNVGSHGAVALAELGMKVTAVSDVTGTVHADAGLDVAALIAHSLEAGGVAGFPGAARMVVLGLAGAAFLEAAAGFCLGCRIFALLMKAGVVPDSVCEECNDLSLRIPALATARVGAEVD